MDPRQGSEPQPGAETASAPQWAWAQQTQIQLVDTEPLEYHRLLRGMARYRWWKPALILLLAGAIYMFFSAILVVVWFGIIVVQQPDFFSAVDEAAFTDRLLAEVALDTQNPLSIFMNLLSVILMIPAVQLAMLIMGARPIGRIWSVATRIRWGIIGRCLGLALLAVVVTNVVGTLIGMALDAGSLAEETQLPSIDLSAALVSLLFVLLLVPLQATAEEVVFRGLFMQVLGSWLRSPWFAILIPSVVFALAHIYDIWGMLVVGMMGFVAAWLTWRTGGLEAAIAIHVVNNLIAFGILASGITGETAQTAEGAGIELVIGEAVGLALYAWLVMRSFRKRGYGRTRIDRVEVAVPVAPPVPPAPPIPPAQEPRHG